MSTIELKLKVSPEIDVSKINVMLSELKSSLGKLGSDIKMIDSDKIAAEYKKVGDSIENIKSKPLTLPSLAPDAGTEQGQRFSNNFSKALNFAMLTQGIQAFAQAADQLSQPFVKYEASLADFSALTGVAGKSLDGFGEKAKELAERFGGDATGQIESFKGVLSRFGPDLAKSPEALEKMSIAINTLAKAGGLDAAASMDALTTAGLQFGVDMSDPTQAAEELNNMINVLAAGAKEGAAEIPQVKEAITVAGVAAKGAKVSFEETNAAIQVLATGGKYGAEAGTALRNVLGKLGEGRFLPKDVQEEFKKAGVSIQTLSDTTIPLSERLTELTKISGDAALMSKLFGTENAAAGTILVTKAADIATMTEKISGTQTAFEQANINMNTTAAGIDRFKAKISNSLTDVFSGLGSTVASFSSSLTQVTPIITTLSGLKNIVPDQAIKGVQSLSTAILSKLIPTFGTQIAAQTAAGASGVASFGAMATAVWAAMAPLLPFIAALGAVGVAAYALSGGFDKSAETILKEAEAEEKNLIAQKNSLEQRKKGIENNLKSIGSYEELSQKENKSAEDKEKLRGMVEKLGRAYPGLNLSMDDHTKNLEKIKNAAGIANTHYSSLDDNTKKLISSFEQLGSKTNKTVEEKQKLSSIAKELQEKFPGVQISTDNYAGSLTNLKEKVGLSNAAMAKMEQQIQGLNSKIAESSKKQVDLKVNVADSGEGGLSKALRNLYASFEGAQFLEAQEKIIKPFKKSMDDALKIDVKDPNSDAWKNVLLTRKLAFQDWIQTFSGKDDEKTLALSKLDEFEKALIAKGMTYGDRAKIVAIEAAKKKQEAEEKAAADAEAIKAANAKKAAEEELKKQEEARTKLNAAIIKLKQEGLDASNSVNKQEMDALINQLESKRKLILDSTEGTETERLKKSIEISKQINEIEMLKDLESSTNKYNAKIAQDKIYYDKELKDAEKAGLSTKELKNVHNEARKQIDQSYFNEQGLIVQNAVDKELSIVKQGNQDIEQAQAKSKEKLGKTGKKSIDEQIKDLEDEYKIKEEDNKAKIEQEKRFNNLMVVATDSTLTGYADRQKEEQLASLEKRKKDGNINDENYNKEKQEIESKHQNKIIVIKAAAAGMQKEIERQAAIDALKIQQEKAGKELELASQSGDEKLILEKLGAFNKLTDELKDKKDLLTQYSEEIQATLTDTFANLFSGDEEKIKEPWKKLFGIIVGALEKLLIADIVKIVLSDTVTSALGVLAIPAKAALFGIVTAGMNALVRPLLSSVASFSVGGQVNEPTTAIIGDNPNSPEWVLRNFDIDAIITKAINRLVNSPDFATNLAVNVQGQLIEVQKKEIDLSNLNQLMIKLSNDIEKIKPNFTDFSAENIIKLSNQYQEQQQLESDFQKNLISESQYINKLNKLTDTMIDYASSTGFLDKQIAPVTDHKYTSTKEVFNNESITNAISQQSPVSTSKRIEEQNDIIIKQNAILIKLTEEQSLKGVFIDPAEMTDYANRENNRRWADEYKYSRQYSPPR